MIFLTRLSLIILLIPIITISCASLQIKRTVEDNILCSSSNPKINIKISEYYDYYQENNDTTSQFSKYSDRSLNVKKENYIFINRIEFANINISFDTLMGNRASWTVLDYKDMKDIIYAGSETINDVEYKYGIFPSYNKYGSFLTKIIGKNYGGNGNILMQIYYSKRIGDINEFKEWSNSNTLKQTQKDKIKEFLDCFERDIKIIN